jgi:hypothetical protein
MTHVCLKPTKNANADAGLGKFEICPYRAPFEIQHCIVCIRRNGIEIRLLYQPAIKSAENSPMSLSIITAANQIRQLVIRQMPKKRI